MRLTTINQLLKQKRALTSYNMIVMITRIIFMVIALLVIVIIINVALDMKLETKETEAVVLIGRLLYSPEGISHADPITGRITTGVVDVDNMNNTRLDNGIYITKNNRIAARIELYEYLSYEDDPKTGFVKVAKFNSGVFDGYEPIADAWSNVAGIGGVFKYETSYPVIIRKEDGKKSLGYVDFKVLIPRSNK
ncbi:hypothetical protein ACFL96_06725 [Thermoproteota archaeon]